MSLADDTPKANGINISTREVYDVVMSLRSDFAALRLDVFAIKSDQQQEATRLARQESSLEKRVRSLELRFYGILAGLVGAVSILISNVVNKP